jgi:hypothetical protein
MADLDALKSIVRVETVNNRDSDGDPHKHANKQLQDTADTFKQTETLTAMQHNTAHNRTLYLGYTLLHHAARNMFDLPDCLLWLVSELGAHVDAVNAALPFDLFFFILAPISARWLTSLTSLPAGHS